MEQRRPEEGGPGWTNKGVQLVQEPGPQPGLSVSGGQRGC